MNGRGMVVRKLSSSSAAIPTEMNQWPDHRNVAEQPGLNILLHIPTMCRERPDPSTTRIGMSLYNRRPHKGRFWRKHVSPQRQVRLVFMGIVLALLIWWMLGVSL